MESQQSNSKLKEVSPSIQRSISERSEETLADSDNLTRPFGNKLAEIELRKLCQSDDTLPNNCNQSPLKKTSQKASSRSRHSSVTKMFRRFSRSRTTSNNDQSLTKEEPTSHVQFDNAHDFHPHQRPSLASRIKRRCIKCRCSQHCLTRFLLNLFPFISILREYNPRSDLVRDLIAGVTVCVMHIPQGMAYGMLAGLAPVYGLYSSLFPVAIYFIFGTSRHISFGTMAVSSLMVSSAITRFLQSSTLPDFITVLGVPAGVAGNYSTNETEGSFNDSSVRQSNVTASATNASVSITATDASCGSRFGAQLADGVSVVIDGRVVSASELRVEIAIAITLLVGIFQVGMSLLRLGFLTIYLSEPLISGFTTGSAVYVATSQLSPILGYRVPNFSGPLNLIHTYVAVFSNIYKINFISFGIAAACIVILAVFKEVIQPLINKKVKFPVPIDLALIIITTVISYLTKLNSVGVMVIGSVPAGIPPPRVPDVRFFPSMVTDCLLIAIIGYATSISMASIMARKYSYEVHSNQEMLANGMSNALSAFLNSHATSTSLSRSLVQDNAGCKSQVASLISCLGILLVLLFLAPLFEFVPRCVLAAIILVALKGMFLQFTELPQLWRTSKYDFAIWTVTFTATVLLDVDYGLICGFVFSVFTIMFRTQAPHTCELGRVRHTTLYKNVHVYGDIIALPGIKVIRFDGALYFASKDHLRAALAHRTGLNPTVVKRKLKQQQKHQRHATQAEVDHKPQEAIELTRKADTDIPVRTPDSLTRSTVAGADEQMSLQEQDKLVANATPVAAIDEHADSTPLTHIVLDCTSITFIDTSGVRVISQIIDEYASIGVRVLLAGPHANIRELFEKMDFYAKHSREIVLVTTHDAVLEALKEQKIPPENAVDFGRALAGVLRDSSEPPVTSITSAHVDVDAVVESGAKEPLSAELRFRSNLSLHNAQPIASD